MTPLLATPRSPLMMTIKRSGERSLLHSAGEWVDRLETHSLEISKARRSGGARNSSWNLVSKSVFFFARLLKLLVLVRSLLGGPWFSFGSVSVRSSFSITTTFFPVPRRNFRTISALPGFLWGHLDFSSYTDAWNDLPLFRSLRDCFRGWFFPLVPTVQANGIQILLFFCALFFGIAQFGSSLSQKLWNEATHLMGLNRVSEINNFRDKRVLRRVLEHNVYMHRITYYSYIRVSTKSALMVS